MLENWALETDGQDSEENTDHVPFKNIIVFISSQALVLQNYYFFHIYRTLKCFTKMCFFLNISY